MGFQSSLGEFNKTSLGFRLDLRLFQGVSKGIGGGSRAFEESFKIL